MAAKFNDLTYCDLQMTYFDILKFQMGYMPKGLHLEKVSI